MAFYWVPYAFSDRIYGGTGSYANGLVKIPNLVDAGELPDFFL